MEADTENIRKDSSNEENKSKDLQKSRSNSSSSSSSIKDPNPIPEHKLDSETHTDSSDSSSGSERNIEVPSQSPRRRTIQEKLSSLTGYGIEISVTNPQIKGSIFAKHVLYTVVGNDSLGGFQVQRRYKEFLSLRKVLVADWPGCCIISLPPKLVMGNREPDFVESRRRLLEYFLKNLTKDAFLLVSEEFQLFLRGPESFHKSVVVNKSINYVQTGQKYSKVFEKYWSYKRNPDVEKEILTAADFFNKGKILIEKLEKSAEENWTLMKSYEKKSDEVVTFIQDFTKNYLKKELCLNPAPTREDPYAEIKTWCMNSLFELKGINECIQRRAEIEKYKNTLVSKIKDEKKSISRRQAGKKKLIQYLNKKSNEYYISQSETIIQQLEEIIAGIEIILNISAALILQEEVPAIKEKKVNTLQIIVEVFEEMSGKEISAFIERYQEIKEKI